MIALIRHDVKVQLLKRKSLSFFSHNDEKKVFMGVLLSSSLRKGFYSTHTTQLLSSHSQTPHSKFISCVRGLKNEYLSVLNVNEFTKIFQTKSRFTRCSTCG
jgi:hypothetical protein